MAKEYLEKLSKLLEEAMPDGNDGVRLETKHFFSGAALYADGRICITLTPVGFALKLPEKLRNELMEQEGAHHPRYFDKAPVKKAYVVLPERMVSDRDTLRYWVKKSVEYALTLPEPKSAKKKARSTD